MTVRRRILAAAVIAAAVAPASASAAPGDLDVSFSGDGKQTTDFGGADAAAAVAMQADGKIVVAGSSGGNFALARYGADGALDPSFSGDGLVTTDLGGTEAGQGVAIIPSVLRTDRYRLRIARVGHQRKALRDRYVIQWDKRRPMPSYAQNFCAELATYMRKVLPITRPS